MLEISISRISHSDAAAKNDDEMRVKCTQTLSFSYESSCSLNSRHSFVHVHSKKKKVSCNTEKNASKWTRAFLIISHEKFKLNNFSQKLSCSFRRSCSSSPTRSAKSWACRTPRRVPTTALRRKSSGNSRVSSRRMRAGRQNDDNDAPACSQQIAFIRRSTTTLTTMLNAVKRFVSIFYSHCRSLLLTLKNKKR